MNRCPPLLAATLLLCVLGPGFSLRGLESPGESFEAVVEPTASLDLALEVSGVVREVHVEEGELVEGGQPLLSLEDQLEQLAVEEATIRQRRAEERLAKLEVKRKRYERLRQQDLLSEDEYLDLLLQLADARSQEELARNQRAVAEEQLRRRTLFAPQAGMVFRSGPSAGEAVRPLESLVTLIDTTERIARFFLPARLVDRYEAGQEVPLRSVGSPQDAPPVLTTVQSVDPFVDPATSQFRLALRLPEDSPLPPGAIVELRPEP